MGGSSRGWDVWDRGPEVGTLDRRMVGLDIFCKLIWFLLLIFVVDFFAVYKID